VAVPCASKARAGVALYWGTRQLAHAVLHREQTLAQGRRVVRVEFPQPESYALGFLTNEDAVEISSALSRGMVSVPTLNS